MSTSITSLTKGLPDELRKYLEYCRSLRFEDKPNYPYLRSLFTEAIHSGKYGTNQQFDWMSRLSAHESGSSRGDDEGNAGASANQAAR